MLNEVVLNVYTSHTSQTSQIIFSTCAPQRLRRAMTGRLQVLAVRVAVVAVLAVLAVLAVVTMCFAVAVWLHFLWELALIVWEKWAESQEKISETYASSVMK